jgi:zinc D-Ala-D-Ala carboxypeptidase
MEKQLTEHFSLAEMSRSETATRKGLDNTIPVNLIPNAVQVAEVLEKIRAHYGKPIRVLSCYRSPDVNKAVGGSKTSAHRFAFAADHEVEGVANIDVCRWIAANIPDFDQVIYEFGPTGWIHIGLSASPRRQSLTAVKRDGKTVYLPGIVET